MYKIIRQNPYTVLMALILWLLTMDAWGIDWQSVPGQKVTLFYPGQASWEWLLTDHKGAAQIKSGKFCTDCHEGMQEEMGQRLVSGQLLEPSPIAGKNGSLVAEVKTAYDQDSFYLHLEWTAGTVPAVKAYPAFEVMASIMLDDGQVPEITRGGCWGACHDDVAGMASAAGKNVNKYLVKSRSKMTRTGGDSIKPGPELKNLFDGGFFAEIWQSRLNRGQPAQAVDGHILETRHDHSPALVSAQAEFKEGKWSVEFSRKLTPAVAGSKNIEPGKTYTFGIAIHDGFVNARHHYVSFGHTLRLEQGPADFIARKR